VRLSDRQREKAKKFWAWWSENIDLLHNVSDADDAAFQKPLDLLQEYDEQLGLEISIGEDKRPYLVITAYGDSDHAASVRELVQLKPADLGDWQVIAFKPASKAKFELELGGFSFSQDRIWFEPLRSSAFPEMLGVRVFFEQLGAIPEEVARTAAGLALMTVLGETRFMETICALEIGDSAAEDVNQHIPLRQLPAFLEWSDRKRTR
jgi:hypothetical protein